MVTGWRISERLCADGWDSWGEDQNDELMVLSLRCDQELEMPSKDHEPSFGSQSCEVKTVKMRCFGTLAGPAYLVACQLDTIIDMSYSHMVVRIPHEHWLPTSNNPEDDPYTGQC